MRIFKLPENDYPRKTYYTIYFNDLIYFRIRKHLNILIYNIIFEKKSL